MLRVHKIKTGLGVGKELKNVIFYDLLNFYGRIYCLFKEKIVGQIIDIIGVVHKSS